MVRLTTSLAALALGITLSNQVIAEDNRFSPEQIEDWAHVGAALDATAMIVHTGAINSLPAGAVQLHTRNLGSRQNLCEDQKFVGEPSVVGACTGFLVGADVILTSLECIRGPRDCEDKKIVFGLSEPGQTRQMLNADDIYSCRAVNGNLASAGSGGFTIVRLDRPVAGRRPLQIADDLDYPGIGRAVAMVGHPQGLASKVSFSEVFSIHEYLNLYRADLPALRGSEGSAILDTQTGEVIGLQHSNLNSRLRENRFRGCYEARVCSGEDCFLEILVPSHMFRDAVGSWNADLERVRL